MLRAFSDFRPKRNDVNVLLLDGGVGDHVGGSLIAVHYILKNYPWINLLIWMPDFLVAFAKNVLPQHACIRPFSVMREKYNRELTTLTTEWDGRTSPMKIHMADYAFLKLCDQMVPHEKKSYLRVLHCDTSDLSPFHLPERFVVVVVGFTAGVREFNAQAVNGVSRYLIEKGYTPVYLGQRATATGVKYVIESHMSKDVDLTLGVDLIDRTDLLQAAAIISRAKAIVGVDCGLLHIAGCTETAIVAGYTTVRPEIRMPIRHGECGWNCYPVTPTVECRYCQSDTNFLYGHNYMYCIYKDNQCVKELTTDKWITQLEKVL